MLPLIFAALFAYGLFHLGLGIPLVVLATVAYIVFGGVQIVENTVFDEETAKRFFTE